MSTIGKRYLFLNARGGWSIADESGIAGNYATEADAHTVAAHDAAVERLDFNAAIDLSYLYLDESERQMELHEPGIAARWNEMAEQLHDWASHRLHPRRVHVLIRRAVHDDAFPTFAAMTSRS